MSGGALVVTSGEEGMVLALEGRGRDTAEHPAAHRTPPRKALASLKC